MELYKQYIKEREDKECIYNDSCFITYKTYDNNVSVIDIYSKPEIRGKQIMLDFVKDFFTDMKNKGFKKAYGFTDENTNAWKKSEQLILKFGFEKIGKTEENYNNYILNLEEY